MASKFFDVLFGFRRCEIRSCDLFPIARQTIVYYKQPRKAKEKFTLMAEIDKVLGNKHEMNREIKCSSNSGEL